VARVGALARRGQWAEASAILPEVQAALDVAAVGGAHTKPPTPEPDGPRDVGEFCFGGKVATRMEPTPWRLLAAVWGAQRLTTARNPL